MDDPLVDHCSLFKYLDNFLKNFSNFCPLPKPYHDCFFACGGLPTVSFYRPDGRETLIVNIVIHIKPWSWVHETNNKPSVSYMVYRLHIVFLRGDLITFPIH